MLQCFTGRDTCPWIIHKDPFQEIQKEDMTFGQRCGDDFLKFIKGMSNTDMEVVGKKALTYKGRRVLTYFMFSGFVSGAGYKR